jgi:two-component system sensor histidine kinase PilS (NtrC family)
VRTTILDREGHPWVTAVVQDNTETKRIEELIHRAERLQAVAELGTSLAHEIRNPLASLRSAAEQLASSPELGAHDREVLRRLVVNESQRLSRLLTDFMEFSGYEASRWGPVDLTKVVEEATELVRQHPSAEGGVLLEMDRPPGAVFVDGDRDLLHRALFNLLLNAVQHSGPGGRVHVHVGRLGAGALPEGVVMAEPICLSVRDSGPGIQDDEMPRIFDPFYTTREGGIGLGLALVHRAVEAHSGSILVDGRLEDGPGARFTVYLPVHADGGRT